MSTNRDEWVFDFSEINLSQKISFFTQQYNQQVLRKTNADDELDYSIKWSAALKSRLKRNEKIAYKEGAIVDLLYRPYVPVKYYSQKELSDRLTAKHYGIFGEKLLAENKVIASPGKYLPWNYQETSLYQSNQLSSSYPQVAHADNSHS